MEKALEILTYMKASINDEEKMHEKLHSMSGDELHTYLFEAIAELEEAMKPKSCDTCRTTPCSVKRTLLELGEINSSYFSCNDYEPKEK